MGAHYAVNPQTGERLMLMGNQWVPATSGNSSSGAPKMTEAQAKDGFNAKRMVGASGILDPLENSGYDPGKARGFNMLGMSEFNHGWTGKATEPGLFASPQTRKYNSAQMEWADSLLRMTTGAAATKDEINNTIATYFPKYGDPDDVRKQKAAARLRVQADALLRAGPSAGNGPARPQAAAMAQQPAPRPQAQAPQGPVYDVFGRPVR